MDFLIKLLFSLKHPKVVVVTGNGRSLAAEAVFQVLRHKFKIKKLPNRPSLREFFSLLQTEMIILESPLDSPQARQKFQFLLKEAERAILIVTAIGEIPADEIFFAGDIQNTQEIIKLVKNLGPETNLVLNFDDETVREIKNKAKGQVLTFGFQEKADFQASDIKITEKGTNFKLNYKGNIVPVWLEGLFGKEQIYSSLAACCLALFVGINLIDACQALKFYHSLPGKMRQVPGNKNSQILDDSQNASAQSMLEALSILKQIKESREKLESPGRTMAVLGDILDVGKYALCVHEMIGTRAAQACDVLWTVGPRGKLILEGAKKAGMAQINLFHFDTVEALAKVLEKEIKENDLILVDGAKEMEMWKVVEEIKSFSQIPK